RRPNRQRAADPRIAGLYRITLQALPALWRTRAHHPARPLAARRNVPAERRVLPRPLAGQRLRHDPLAAHGDASLHAAGCHAAHPWRVAGRTLVAARRGRQGCACRAGTHRRHRGAGHRTGRRLARVLAHAGQPPNGALAAARLHRRTARRLAGREGVVMTTVSASCTAPHPRAHLRARLVLTALSVCGLAALAWASFVQPLPRLIYNPSDSVPVGWYRVEPLDHRAGSLPVGSIIQTTLPPAAATL